LADFVRQDQAFNQKADVTNDTLDTTLTLYQNPNQTRELMWLEILKKYLIFLGWMS
jgi:hypothetical protein